ncbi:MAG: MarR family winged helix-turn-helix transcriptional regulator [Microbacteriaceae bacterium]|nr:MarR family winged helix-turn-helix transcriptional regulator [Microbacteriaceae bacterium]MCL2794444.1 MarR family winged helix-turn-helix transcriptional regulator [Microbacteriaceae bacterium]
MARATKPTRAQLLDTIFEEMNVITRRGTARARRLAAPLTYVEHTLLQFIGATPGCRATDIATSFHLNRSTVSRQVASLLEHDLVEYAARTDESHHRGRELQLTAVGTARLASARDEQRKASFERLDEWSESELSTFAALLERYNLKEPTV